MREIQASEAQVHFSQLLDDVEGGETLVVTRHGRRVARVTPELDWWQEAMTRLWRGYGSCVWGDYGNRDGLVLLW